MDAQTGQELVTLKGHTSRVTSVTFSPDGKRLASAGGGEVKVWDATTSPEARTFGESTGQYRSVAFSPDGKRLASGGGTWDDAKNAYVAGEGKVKVWDVQTAQELFTLKGHTSSVTSVAFSPDGKRLASGGGTWDGAKQAFVSGEVKVWDAQTGQELLTFKGHTAAVVSVAFSPDSKRLASCSSLPGSISPSGDPGEPGEVKVWDARTGQELLTLKGHSRFVNSVAYSPDGKRLATLSRDHTVKVWDAQTGQEIRTIKPVRTNIPGCIVFSPDGKRLASTDGGGVKVCDVQTGQEILTLEGHTYFPVWSVAFSPDGKRLASAAWGEVKLWDAQTGQELLSLQGGNWVVFSPDGKRLASNSGTGHAPTIWDATPLPEKP